MCGYGGERCGRVRAVLLVRGQPVTRVTQSVGVARLVSSLPPAHSPHEETDSVLMIGDETRVWCGLATSGWS